MFIKNKNKYFKRFKREEIKVPVLNILIENVLMFSQKYDFKLFFVVINDFISKHDKVVVELPTFHRC